MNWAYGVEFLEIDPSNWGPTPSTTKKTSKLANKLIEQLSVDKDRLRALHGTQVVSDPIPFGTPGWFPLKPDTTGLRRPRLHRWKKRSGKAAILIGEDLLQEDAVGTDNSLVDLDVPEVSYVHHCGDTFGD